MNRIKINHAYPKIIVSIFIILYTTIFTFLTFNRHDGLKTQMNDLGNMEQPIYNTTQGKFMFSSNYIPAKKYEMSRFGIHANFILLFFIPLYHIFPEPKILIITQTIIIALGAMPLYLLTKHLFRNKWIAILPPFLYLMSSHTHDVTIFDFHAASLAMPIIIFSFYSLYTKKYKWFYISGTLLALCKEDMPLIICMMGLYLIFFQKELKKGIFVSSISFAYFLFITILLMPTLSNNNLAIIQQRYSYLGNGIPEIIKNAILNPRLILTNMFSMQKIAYLGFLLIPVFFVPLLEPQVFLLALPTILINLLSQNSMTYYPFTYYHKAPILSFIFLALIIALSKTGKTRWLKPQLKKIIIPFVIIDLILFTTALSFLLSPVPFPYSPSATIEEYIVTKHAKNISILKKQIPHSASLSIQNNLGAHFSQRTFIYTFPYNAHKTDFTLIDINDPAKIIRTKTNLSNFFFYTQIEPQKYYNEITKMFLDKSYGVLYYSEDGYLLFKKGMNKQSNKKAFEIFNKNIKKIFSRYNLKIKYLQEYPT